MISFLDSEFSQLNEFLAYLQPTQIFILVDENTHEYCLPMLLGNLQTDLPFEIIDIEAGEELKTIETATHLWEILAGFSADRQSLVLNLGGGVVTDLGGFVASVYKRGIPFVHIPTTLLAMCDAAIGGKTGIDQQFLKNIVGTFALPEAIFVFDGFLKTLPVAELRSGFAEMLKHGLVADENHWKELIIIENISAESVSPFINTSIMIKQAITEKDFREKNLRKTLNFGHSIGHAIESMFLQSENPLKHGEAVAIGMICETRLSFDYQLISEDICEQVIMNIRKYFPPVSIAKFGTEQILSFIKNDKKNAAGNFRFSLLSGIGSCKFDCAVSEKSIEGALQFYQNLE